jgi:hypothetical protein
LALGVATLALGCSRETIGLGRSTPDSTVPPSDTSTDRPPPSPDAGASKPTPSSSAPHSTPPFQLPHYPPTHPREDDAGGQTEPPPPGPPAPEVDAGSGCKGMSDCDSNKPSCLLDTGKCVQCQTDFGCPIGLHCVSNECVCITAADCRYTLGTTCDQTTRQCLVPCNEPTDCGGLFSARCETTRGVCIECDEDAQCKDKMFGSVYVEHCHNALCVQCLQDSDCPDPKSHCLTGEGICVDCLRSDHCPDKSVCFNGHCTPSQNASTPP